jgi:hypothetical protein
MQKEEFKKEGHEYNGSYSGKYLDRIAFPVGGMSAGMFCIDGTGSISLSVGSFLSTNTNTHAVDKTLNYVLHPPFFIALIVVCAYVSSFIFFAIRI